MSNVQNLIVSHNNQPTTSLSFIAPSLSLLPPHLHFVAMIDNDFFPITVINISLMEFQCRASSKAYMLTSAPIHFQWFPNFMTETSFTIPKGQRTMIQICSCKLPLSKGNKTKEGTEIIYMNNSFLILHIIFGSFVVVYSVILF